MVTLSSYEQKQLRVCLIWSFLLHLAAAYFSIGHHSADEHFQILEFLNYKLGLTPQSVLAVEFGEKMRPWFQPWLYYGVVKIFQAFGDVNPFHWAIGLRGLSALIGWSSLVLLCLAFRVWFPSSENLRVWGYRLVAFLWFLPGLHARTSSESLSGSFFLAGLATWVVFSQRGKCKAWVAFVTGLLFGCAFECRFQIGFMILGFSLWWIFIEQIRLRLFLVMSSGILIVLCMGRVIDYWGYGQWVFSPWNYIDYNLLRNIINQFGRSPWWDVFRMSFTETWPGLGTLTLIVGVHSWIKAPRHVLTWSLVPFFLIHCLIAHKELRFFFPMALCAPGFFLLGLADFLEDNRMGAKTFFKVIAVWNFIGLIATTFLPFSRVIVFQKGLYEEAVRAPSQINDFVTLWTEHKDPYEILGTDTYFYRAKNVVVQKRSYLHLAGVLKPGDLLFVPGLDFNSGDSSPESILESNLEPYNDIRDRCQRQMATLPTWVTRLNINDWVSRSSLWSLWKCP